jgi:hypothetical protein
MSIPWRHFTTNSFRRFQRVVSKFSFGTVRAEPFEECVVFTLMRRRKRKREGDQMEERELDHLMEELCRLVHAESSEEETKQIWVKSWVKNREGRRRQGGSLDDGQRMEQESDLGVPVTREIERMIVG